MKRVKEIIREIAPCKYMQDSDYGSIPSYYMTIQVGQWDKPYTQIKKTVEKKAKINKNTIEQYRAGYKLYRKDKNGNWFNSKNEMLVEKQVEHITKLIKAGIAKKVEDVQACNTVKK